MSEVRLKVMAKRAKELILLGIVDLNKIDPRSMWDALTLIALDSDNRYMEREEARRR